MAQNLVIVESPAKARTIEKYLGKDFHVLASYGHVRDLIPKEGAVETDNDFAMKYAVIDRNAKHVSKIASELKKADNLYLATDPDREGEAIAWHLLELLKEKNLIKSKPVHRVVFHEITKRAINDAVDSPREISDQLVNAQQARRALDYLVGFNLSPLLWRKVQRGLSAGRVQSPALRMICEREAEIDAFVSQEYWSIEALAAKEGQSFSAKLTRLSGEKVEQFTVTNEAQAQEVESALRKAADGSLKVATVEKKQRRRNPAPPFTTSTLQQEASRKLGFAANRTMRVAQQLYEGVDIGGETVGLISYMRTDSVSLANEALNEIRGVIEQRYGDKALPEKPRFFKSKSKNAQEAHEAIRPTSAQRIPGEIEQHLQPDQFRLYDLIWKRAVACQMQHATFDTVGANLHAGSESNVFRATGSVLVEPGFIAVYQEGRDDAVDDDDDKRLPALVEGETVKLEDIIAGQHFTEPPPRFSEASLVKTLEEYDIGRPSTYASIISTLLNREYVELENKRFRPTDVGRIVNDFLTKHFERYVDYEFTAKLEDQLDAISRGEKEWQPVLSEFWETFHAQVESKKDISREEVAQARQLGVDPDSGKPVTVRLGRYGPYVQIGTKDDEDKPKFAGLRPGQRMDEITFDDAMELFKLPRELGETAEGEKVSASIGRFGPYVKYGSKFVSIKEPDDPYTIELPRALEVIAEKKAADAAKLIQDFPDEGIQVINGRYGPYITNKKKNAKIPKDEDPAKLTLEQCIELLDKAPERKGRGRKAGAKKPATKKTAASKKPAKKTAAKKSGAKTARKKTSKAASKKTAS